MPPLEFSHSQPIDQAALQHLSPASPACSFAHEVQTQVAASMAHPMPTTGFESMMAAPAAAMPPVPGAEQAISPLIQMIMRMPGHIGLASSFFEALGNFFMPQADMLNLFDPTHFGLHFDLSAALPADHSVIDFSLLPHDAPFLEHLGTVDLSSTHSLDLASDKLNISLGGHASHFANTGGSTSLSMGAQYNVSAPASLAKPQFEGAGGLVSGPSVSENFSSDSLASNNRLFSDGASISSASNNVMIAGGSATSGMLAAPSLTQNAASLGSSASLSSNTLPSGAGSSAIADNGGAMVDNVSAHASPANNVSYNVLEKITGNKEILAANNVSDSYHSTIGTIQPDAPPDAVTHTGEAANHAGSTANHAAGSANHTGGTANHAGSSHASATTGSDNLGGLEAKPMSLDGSRVEFKADHAHLDQHKIDHVEHTASANHTADHVAEHKVEHNVEHKAEHQSEHHTDHKVAHNVEHSAESKVSDAASADKVVDQIRHQTIKPVHHVAAHTTGPDHPAVAAHPATPSQVEAASHQTAPSHPAVAAHPAALAHSAVAAHPASPVHQAVAAHPAAPAHQAVAANQSMQNHSDPQSAVGHAAGQPRQIASQSQHIAPVDNNVADTPVAHGQINQADNVQTTADGQNDATQNPATTDAQSQFGEPVKASGDAAANNGDATQTQPTDASGQTLEQRQAPEIAKSYTIRSGDCLWNIAKDQLGDATKWSDIYKINNDLLGSNPSLIHPGVQIQLPGADGAASGNIAHYTVKAGDNLWDIAKNQTGDATKWGDLYKANQDVIGSNPSLIRPGQELTIATGGADPSGAQVTSMGSAHDPSLAQAPAHVHTHAPVHTTAAPTAHAQHAGGDTGTVSQAPQGIETYGDGQTPDMQASNVQHSSDTNFEAAPMSHNIQPPQAPQGPAVAPGKVMPVPAQPDAIIQPAHAADMPATGLTSEAANAARSLSQSQKMGAVDTNVASDLMTFLNKRR